MLAPISYLEQYHFPPVDVGIVFAKNLDEQAKLDQWAVKHFKGRPVGVLAYFQILRNTNEMFTTLFMILNVVIATLVVVLTFMMGMLINIYQSQRLVEFGLLQAIGYTKARILKRVLTETLLVIVFGWALGVVSAYGLLTVAKTLLMDPKAFELNVVDPIAFMYTIPLPIMILFTASASVILRFRNFDPVGVVERRLV
jgi:ABC-type lipoprotein release transport system permease subunit